MLFAYTASAQQTKIGSALQKKANLEEPGMPIKDVISHIGSDVYVRDTISEHRIVNDSTKLLYLGGKYPKQVLTIIIKGKKLNKQLASWFKEEIGHFSGKAILYESKPAIIITSEDQLKIKIQI
jgi:hypothetical protein